MPDGLGRSEGDTVILQRFRERARSIWESLPQPAHVTVSPPGRDQNGFRIHNVRSPYQARTTRIRVLLPESRKSQGPYPAVYVLPVETRDGNHYGDGLREVQKHDLQNRYRAIFVAPTFSHLPWYADHPSDPLIRQETYLLDVVVPFLGTTYPVIDQPRGRLLLGFSKSGWGACTLLLRHPEVFGRAASWDAPVMMEWPSQFASAEIFGTRENFELYSVQRLLREKGGVLGSQRRLRLTGGSVFGSQHDEMLALLRELHIRHEHSNDPDRPHDWHSGWVSEAVVWLFSNPDPAGDLTARV